MTGRDRLRAHLVRSGLAGQVATPPSSTLQNCALLCGGDERHTFGLSDWRDATVQEAVDAVRSVCGAPPNWLADSRGRGWIDPDATLAGIDRHRSVLAEFAALGGGRVLLATGHPTGLLGHYVALARGLQRSGCRLLAVLDDTDLDPRPDGSTRRVRYIDGVACCSDGASLRHTHRPRYMDAILDACEGQDWPDLVVADHGMAGAAIERGIRTLSIADVNDPGLPLAQVRGRTDGVLPIDDNLAPRLFVPVTTAILAWEDRNLPE